jgi:hypothetical protein
MQLKSELARLSAAQQHELAAYLGHLRALREPKLRREITRRNSSRSTRDWVSLERLKKHWRK